MSNRNNRSSFRPVKQLILLLLAVALVFVFISLIAGSRRQLFRSRHIDPDKPMVALTFDDGPSSVWSPVILDCLEENNAVATFFEVGLNVEEYPEISRRASDIGCEIGSHTYGHLNLRTSDIETIRRDMEKCEAVFKDAIGYVPALVRPPEGSIGSDAKELYNHAFVCWSVDTEDWLSRDTVSVINKVKNAGDLDGQVILMHSLYESSANAAEVIIPWLIDEGYQLVTVSELMEYRYSITPEKHKVYTVDFFLYGVEP